MERRGRIFSLILLLVLIGVVTVALINHPKININGIYKKAEVTQPGLYSVDHFDDGDTIAVNMNGSIETVRFIGIDTPETHKPNTPVQCYGPEASAYTKKFIGNQKVRLVADPTNTNRDRYGRLLRYVYLPDGRLVEEELINKGYAFSYTQFPFQKADDFDKLELAAKDSSTGLWGACKVIVEDNGREQTEFKN